MEQLSKLSFEKLHMVFGMVNDKEILEILSILPKHAEYYFCKANIPRALNENELMQAASEFKLGGSSYVSVQAALDAASKSAGERDLIFIGGSVFVVAEAI
jgi:dihydrofolate synthase/folylpolyglutamate synthase